MQGLNASPVSLNSEMDSLPLSPRKAHFKNFTSWKHHTIPLLVVFIKAIL